MYKRWTVSKPDMQAVENLCETLGIESAAAKVAVARGFYTAEELSAFLSDDEMYIDPFELSGIASAVRRVSKALYNNEKILVFGDYDCDGVTATAVLYSYLESVGADVIYAVPDRQTEGYGLNNGQIDIAAQKGVKLIVTVDNGINCCRECEYAATKGIDVVITDHHMPQQEIPVAAAIVDPHLHDKDAKFSALAGVGVAFMLITALSGKTLSEMLWQYGDLVAIGTVADVMELTGINRFIVKTGVDVMNTSKRVGISALYSIAGLGEKEVTASSISFMLAPRINAAGRIESAMTAIKLLLSNDYDEAQMLASKINEMNGYRQQIEAKIVAEAVEKIEKGNMKYDHIIVVTGEGWHQGVVGIAAARLVEKYARPVVVLSIQGDTACGSARGVAGFSLFDAINDVSDILVRFGGHELAAGLTIKTDQIDLLRKRINSLPITENMPFLTVRSDSELDATELTIDAAYALSEFEPFGTGNPVPVFLIRGVKIERITPLSGGNHQKISFSKNGVHFQAILFGTKTHEFSLYEGNLADISVTLGINEYKGTESLSVQIKAIRGMGAGGSECERGIRCYEAFKRGDDIRDNLECLIPDRNDFATVYRFVSSLPFCTRDAVRYAVGKQIGYGKCEICIDVLCDENLILKEDNQGTIILQKNSVSKKADLENSMIIRKLKERQV